MEVEPAHIDQVLIGEDGKVYDISAESCSVAADLQAIDRGLKVRFSERGECFIVRHEHHPGCPHNGDQGPGSSYLVLTAKAQRGRTGVWTGLDQRVVDRIRYIDPHGRSGYDFVRELEMNRIRGEEEREKAFRERVGEGAELAAFALRKDLGLGPYKGRIFT